MLSMGSRSFLCESFVTVLPYFTRFDTPRRHLAFFDNCYAPPMVGWILGFNP